MQEPKVLKMALANKGLIIDYQEIKKALGEKKLKKLFEQLTLTKKMFIGKDRTQLLVTKLYKFVTIPSKNGGVRKLLTIPRFFEDWVDDDLMPPYKIRTAFSKEIKKLAPEKFINGNDEIGIKHEGKYDFQQPISDYLIEEVYKPDEKGHIYNRGCTFVLDTGRGKTYLGGGLIRRLGVKTLIIAHNERGLEEWKKMLQCYPEIDIGYYYGRKKIDGDVVIMLINSAMRDNFAFRTGKGKNSKITTISRDKYFREFGFVIYDEVPDYVGEQRRKVFWETNFKYCLGLTATPDLHLKDLDPVYKMHLGDLLYAEDIPGVDFEDIEWDFTVRTIKYSGPEEYTKQIKSDITDMTIAARMDKQFAKDPYRNRLILDTIKEYYDEGKYIFIFAGVREILDVLEKLIKKHLGLNPIKKASDKDKVAGIKGGASAADVERAVEKSRIILTTYQYGGKGLSIVKMDCGIQYTPRRNGLGQVTGRLTRMGGDISIPRVWVDIRDMETNAKTQYSDRKKAYNEKGFDITEEDISFKKLKPVKYK
jgi:superfamily II DNA or RNA helicase